MIWYGSSWRFGFPSRGGLALRLNFRSRFGRGRVCMAVPLRLPLLTELLQGGLRQQQPLRPQHAVGVELGGRANFDAPNVAGRLEDRGLQASGPDQARQVVQ